MIEYIFNWLVIPMVVAWGLTNFFWRRLNRKESKSSSEKIKSLISTEQQGDFVNVSFLMEDGSVRNFQVEWLSNMASPNRVMDLDSWDELYNCSSPRMHNAAQHAARLHYKGGGKTNKNVYDSNQDWRLM